MFNDQYYNDNYNYYNQQEAQISIYDSIQIALNHIYGQVIKVELEREDGFLVYEVDILTPEGIKYEIEVDVDTGNIVKVEID